VLILAGPPKTCSHVALSGPRIQLLNKALLQVLTCVGKGLGAPRRFLWLSCQTFSGVNRALPGFLDNSAVGMIDFITIQNPQSCGTTQYHSYDLTSLQSTIVLASTTSVLMLEWCACNTWHHMHAHNPNPEIPLSAPV